MNATGAGDADAQPVSSAIRSDGTVLGFDVGARRIGVAVGNGMTGSARAVAVIDVHAAGPDWAHADRLLREWRPDGLVVGDPMTLDGGDQPIRKLARVFAQTLRQRFFAAARAEGRSKRRDAEALDAVAAAVIVERWLASPQLAQAVD